VRTGRLALPLLPGAAGEIVSICSDEASCDVGELTERLRRDPSLAGNVLRMANSAAFAPGESIVSLQQAVSRLGLWTLRDIALAVAMRGEVFLAEGSDVQELWQHCATAGVWARELARLRRRNVESAFLAALMHDAGKPLVVEAGIELGIEDAVELAALAHELHAEVGERLVTEWQLGPWLAAAIGAHHAPALAGAHAELAHATHLADRLAHWTRSPELAPEAELRADPSWAELGVYPAEVERLLARRDDVREGARGLS
jgi:HD-like signal output (HDOD) protein